MERRTTTSAGSLRRATILGIAACVGLMASCGTGSAGVIKRASAATSVSTTTVADTSTTTSTTTVPADPATTTVAPVETTVPVATTPPPPIVPGDHQGEGDTATGPPPEVVRPPAAWIGFGVPQPGSMFENLHEDHSLDGKGRFVALTFDDGPSQYTKPILDILNFMGVKATFFQITTQSMARQDLVRSMLASGMHIGSHTKTHPHLRELSPDLQRDQVIGSIDQLDATFGEGSVKCFRPPYAQYDQNVLNLVGERGAAIAMWSLDTLDWKKPAWQSLVNRIVNGAQDRNVLLFHDGGGDRTETIAALPWIIQGLRDKGFQFIQVC